MATAYLFSHTLTSDEADSLNANTPVQIVLKFPTAQTGGNWAVSVCAEDVSSASIAPFVVGISDVGGDGFTLNYASFSVGAVAGDIVRFHVLVQQVQ